MKIFNAFYLAFAVLICHDLHSSQQQTLTTALGNLSSQLQQLAYAAAPFPSHIAPLPKGTTILDNQVSVKAPSLENLKVFAQATGIELIQLVVVWQDLSLAQFGEKKDEVEKRLETLLALESGNTPTKIMECLLKDPENKRNISNKNLQDLLIASKKAANVNASIGGGSASCGYHTLCHLNTLHQFFVNKTADLGDLTNIEYVNSLFGLDNVNNILNPVIIPKKIPSPGTWRDKIIKKQTEVYEAGKTDFLTNNPTIKINKDEFEAWINQDINKEQRLEFQHSLLSVSTRDGEWLTHPGIVYLLDNIDILKTIDFRVWPQPILTEKLVELVRKSIALPSFQKPIIVNIDNNHWYGVYLRKTNNNPTILCIVVDSKNEPRYNTNVIINMLTGLFPDKTKLITSNQHLLQGTSVITENKEVENIRLLRIWTQSIDPSTLKENLPQQLSEPELLFIFNEFTYFELVRDILQNYKIFIGAYNYLKNQKITTTTRQLTDLSSWLEKNNKIDKDLAETVSQIIFPVFGNP